MTSLSFRHTLDSREQSAKDVYNSLNDCLSWPLLMTTWIRSFSTTGFVSSPHQMNISRCIHRSAQGYLETHIENVGRARKGKDKEIPPLNQQGSRRFDPKRVLGQ
jgi:hypothetical protein